MKIYIETPVASSYKEVMAGFDRNLFEALTPPGAKVELLRFDGSSLGDIVHLRLKLLWVIETDWISDIVEEGTNDQEAYFVDQGTHLPFFLSAWRHRHVVKNVGDGSIIIDDIEFTAHNKLFSLLLYPMLYLQFLYRKPIYQKFFGKRSIPMSRR